MKEFFKKFRSMKLMVTIWCIVLLSVSVIRGYDANWLNVLAAVPIAYCGFNVWQDKIFRE